MRNRAERVSLTPPVLCLPNPCGESLRSNPVCLKSLAMGSGRRRSSASWRLLDSPKQPFVSPRFVRAQSVGAHDE
jgi:hypothetical protein